VKPGDAHRLRPQRASDETINPMSPRFGPVRLSVRQLNANCNCSATGRQKIFPSGNTAMPDRNEELVCEEKMDRIAEELEELMLDALLKGRFPDLAWTAEKNHFSR